MIFPILSTQDPNLFVILKALLHRIHIAFTHLKSGDHRLIFQGFTTRLYSDVKSYGLEQSAAKVITNELLTDELQIRLFTNNDLNRLNEKMRHIRLVKENIPTCYIAENKDQIPVFRQWVFKHDQNDRIQNFFGGIFPRLSNDEALLEGGFTHEHFRGQRIMSKGILNILNLPEHKDIRRFITFVDVTNIPSIKGLQRAGFTPYAIRYETWRFFKRKVTITPISKADQNTYFSLSTK